MNSKRDDLVLEAVRVNAVVQVPQESQTVARQKIHASDGSLLQALFWIQRITQQTCVAV